MKWIRFYLSIFSLLFLQLSCFAVEIPSQESANHEQLCTQSSTKVGVFDKEQFKLCMQEQLDSYHEIVDIVNKYKDYDWIEGSLNHALRNWTKRGLRDDEMVAADLRADIDAYEDLAYEYKQNESNKKIIDKCWSQYKNDWILIRNCYRGR